MLSLSLLALLACTGAEAVDSTPAVSDDTQATQDDSAPTSDDSAEDTDATCAEEGETCVAYDDGTSNCCIGRHTCYPEGCYYSQP